MGSRAQSPHQRILAAAEKLFAEQGYKETTTREIVQEAGASLSSLQAHFQGKESVYFQVRCRAVEELYQFMRPSLEEIEYMDSQDLLRGEMAWNLLCELLSKWIEWCFDEKNRHIIILITRELLDGAPVQGIPEEKLEAVAASVRRLSLRYVGAEDGDWAQMVGDTVFATIMGMAWVSHQDAKPENVHFRLSPSREKIKYQVKNYVLITLRAYLDHLKVHPQGDREKPSCEKS